MKVLQLDPGGYMLPYEPQQGLCFKLLAAATSIYSNSHASVVSPSMTRDSQHHGTDMEAAAATGSFKACANEGRLLPQGRS